MKVLDLPTKRNTASFGKKSKVNKSPSTLKSGKSGYCQKCGNETKDLFEIPFAKKTTYSSSKKNRKTYFETIKVCSKCLNKEVDKI